jgi:hypothetical protein
LEFCVLLLPSFAEVAFTTMLFLCFVPSSREKLCSSMAIVKCENRSKEISKSVRQVENGDDVSVVAAMQIVKIIQQR